MAVQVSEVDTSKAAQRGRWAKQLLLNLSYGTLALNACIRGPTLLDLEDIYQTNTATVAYSFLFGSSCSIIGSVLMGVLMHKLPKLHFTLMFMNVVLIGVTNAMLPHCGYLWLFFLASAGMGFTLGATHTGCNVLCMEIWRGLNPAPYMHGMFFFFSLGALLASVLAKPFLSSRVLERAGNLTQGPCHVPLVNESEALLILDEAANTTASEATETSIGTLYPLCALVAWTVALGHLYLGAKEIMGILRRRRSLARSRSAADATPHEDADPAVKEPFFGNTVAVQEKKVLLGLMMIFFSIYMCSEFAVVSFLPAFAVKCDLCLSKGQGAILLTVFLLPFAIKRLVAMFLAMKLRATTILTINIFLTSMGNLLLLGFGEHDFYVLHAGYIFCGLGMGSMYANALIWVEQYIPVKGRISAALNSCGAVGVTLSPLILGNLVDLEPMSLPYVQTTVTALSVLIFAIGSVFGSRILKAEAAETAQKGTEEAQKLNAK